MKFLGYLIFGFLLFSCSEEKIIEAPIEEMIVGEWEILPFEINGYVVEEIYINYNKDGTGLQRSEMSGSRYNFRWTFQTDPPKILMLSGDRDGVEEWNEEDFFSAVSVYEITGITDTKMHWLQRILAKDENGEVYRKFRTLELRKLP